MADTLCESVCNDLLIESLVEDSDEEEVEESVSNENHLYRQTADVSLYQATDQELLPHEIASERFVRKPFGFGRRRRLRNKAVEVERTNGLDLWRACASGDFLYVQQTILMFPHLIHLEQQGRTPLYLACHAGHVKIVELLLQAGATDEDGSIFSSSQHPDCRALLQQYRIIEDTLNGSFTQHSVNNDGSHDEESHNTPRIQNLSSSGCFSGHENNSDQSLANRSLLPAPVVLAAFNAHRIDTVPSFQVSEDGEQSDEGDDSETGSGPGDAREDDSIDNEDTSQTSSEDDREGNEIDEENETHECESAADSDCERIEYAEIDFLTAKRRGNNFAVRASSILMKNQALMKAQALNTSKILKRSIPRQSTKSTTPVEEEDMIMSPIESLKLVDYGATTSPSNGLVEFAMEFPPPENSVDDTLSEAVSFEMELLPPQLCQDDEEVYSDDRDLNDLFDQIGRSDFRKIEPPPPDPSHHHGSLEGDAEHFEVDIGDYEEVIATSSKPLTIPIPLEAARSRLSNPFLRFGSTAKEARLHHEPPAAKEVRMHHDPPSLADEMGELEKAVLPILQGFDGADEISVELLEFSRSPEVPTGDYEEVIATSSKPLTIPIPLEAARSRLSNPFLRFGSTAKEARLHHEPPVAKEVRMHHDPPSLADEMGELEKAVLPILQGFDGADEISVELLEFSRSPEVPTKLETARSLLSKPFKRFGSRDGERRTPDSASVPEDVIHHIVGKESIAFDDTSVEVNGVHFHPAEATEAPVSLKSARSLLSKRFTRFPSRASEAKMSDFPSDVETGETDHRDDTKETRRDDSSLRTEDFPKTKMTTAGTLISKSFMPFGSRTTTEDKSQDYPSVELDDGTERYERTEERGLEETCEGLQDLPQVKATARFSAGSLLPNPFTHFASRTNSEHQPRDSPLVHLDSAIERKEGTEGTGWEDTSEGIQDVPETKATATLAARSLLSKPLMGFGSRPNWKHQPRDSPPVHVDGAIEREEGTEGSGREDTSEGIQDLPELKTRSLISKPLMRFGSKRSKHQPQDPFSAQLEEESEHYGSKMVSEEESSFDETHGSSELTENSDGTPPVVMEESPTNSKWTLPKPLFRLSDTKEPRIHHSVSGHSSEHSEEVIQYLENSDFVETDETLSSESSGSTDSWSGKFTLYSHESLEEEEQAGNKDFCCLVPSL